MPRPVLQIRDLITEFRAGAGVLRAVDGLSLNVDQGEIVALVGESGCGKSATALSVMRLIPKAEGWIAGGEIVFENMEMSRLTGRQLRGLRGNRMAMVFQEPMTSLNPVLTVGEQIVEVLRLHRGLRGAEAKQTAIEALARVQIADAAKHIASYPHQLSGGMRQRVMLAMALVCQPALLIADEPTTALDVTVQAEILALLARLAREFDLAVLLITHDLEVIARLARRVVVIYAGQAVEVGPTAALLARPLHPYTEALLASRPGRDRRGHRLDELAGAPGEARDERGCRFAPRCPHALAACRAGVPPLSAAGGDGSRQVRCLTPRSKGESA